MTISSNLHGNLAQNIFRWGFIIGIGCECHKFQFVENFSFSWIGERGLGLCIHGFSCLRTVLKSGNFNFNMSEKFEEALRGEVFQ